MQIAVEWTDAQRPLLLAALERMERHHLTAAIVSNDPAFATALLILTIPAIAYVENRDFVREAGVEVERIAANAGQAGGAPLTGWRVWMPGSPVGSQPFARGRETGAAGRAAADAALRAAGVLEAGRSVVKSL